ncbi:unnamed protein product, partial [Symbiodinium pilosum]
EPFEPPDLLICEGNWTEAEKDPDTFRALVQEEVAQGWLEKVGALEQAQARWPDMVAVGRCNLVKSEGRETRLVLDSSVPNASFLIPEKYSLPGLSDVRAAWPLRGRTEEAELFAVDIRAAHKSVRDDCVCVVAPPGRVAVGSVARSFA